MDILYGPLEIILSLKVQAIGDFHFWRAEIPMMQYNLMTHHSSCNQLMRVQFWESVFYELYNENKVKPDKPDSNFFFICFINDVTMFRQAVCQDVPFEAMCQK